MVKSSGPAIGIPPRPCRKLQVPDHLEPMCGQVDSHWRILVQVQPQILANSREAAVMHLQSVPKLTQETLLFGRTPT